MTRIAMLEKLSSVLEVLRDGSPFSEYEKGFNPGAFVASEVDEAPEDEPAVLMDLLRRPPSEEELTAARSDWDDFADATSPYLAEYLVRDPEAWRSTVEETIVRDETEPIVLGALSIASANLTFDSTPFVSAVQRVVGPPWTFDRMLGILGGLRCARSQEALDSLKALIEVVPDDSSGYPDLVRRAMSQVVSRLAASDETPSSFLQRITAQVRAVRARWTSDRRS